MKKGLNLLLILLLGTSVISCERDSVYEDTGERIEDGVEDAGENVEDTVD